MLKAKQLVRVFKSGTNVWPDPGKTMTPDEVQKFLAGNNPELTNATYTSKIEKDQMVYTFSAISGKKG